MRVSNSISIFFTILFLAIFWGCRSAEEVTKPGVQKGEPEKEANTLQAIFEDSEVFSGIFTGFMLYDPDKDSVLYAQNENRYFTPASNTKLFTFYTGLKMLPDSLPGIQYFIKGDSLIFRGTGDPSFLHPDFGNPAIFQFLKESDNELYYTDEHFDDEVLGPGWSWSDFNSYYSAEKSPFPVFGNVMRVTVEEIEQLQIASDSSGLKVSPAFFRSKIENKVSKKNPPLIERDFFDNQFRYNPRSDTTTYTTDKPFHYTPELITEMLSDTLGKPVTYIASSFTEDYKTIYSVQADSVYKRMLQPSDNFIAEQILLVTASQMGELLNSRTVIEYMKKNHLSGMPDEPQWVDGSGLSRYNMFTPRSIIWLLEQIDNEFLYDPDLFELLPAGGESGTIKNWYAAPDSTEPYVFAKTGTLSNNHCLSGFVITNTGKKLLFSFMNNHYVTSSSIVKNEMEYVLRHIRTTY
ncbi:MAG: D-alanyl-D-alanine carboxypeptidase [Gracilimonas sp.]|uniref:D-alanyl-D-alanine carboxypeptidase/D-alanyl-D-alanine-endopeptidase n=1 Tax=Gracilimonas sp. TaxID=1974203 RepID=UPI0019C298F5|nr:D-alanyl-D-alanine carboxypeptidase [Gracilimonas sp.]MBD3616670.1 D-alanyl-D-alanine carboxypeptidase [Gracilimonas sp.]